MIHQKKLQKALFGKSGSSSRIPITLIRLDWSCFYLIVFTTHLSSLFNVTLKSRWSALFSLTLRSMIFRRLFRVLSLRGSFGVSWAKFDFWEFFIRPDGVKRCCIAERSELEGDRQSLIRYFLTHSRLFSTQLSVFASQFYRKNAFTLFLGLI